MFYGLLAIYSLQHICSQCFDSYASVIVTADHSFIRFHGRNTKGHYWYNYLYSKQELEPWMAKVNQTKQQTKILRVYFNNHYGGKAVVNVMQSKEMNGLTLSADERKVLENAQTRILGN